MSLTVMVSGRLIDKQSARSIKSSKERSSIAARCIRVAISDPSVILSSTDGFSTTFSSLEHELRNSALQTKRILKMLQQLQETIIHTIK